MLAPRLVVFVLLTMLNNMEKVTKEKPLSLEEVYMIADKVAKSCNQVVGTRNDFYITLKQLMEIMS